MRYGVILSLLAIHCIFSTYAVHFGLLNPTMRERKLFPINHSFVCAKSLSRHGYSHIISALKILEYPRMSRCVDFIRMHYLNILAIIQVISRQYPRNRISIRVSDYNDHPLTVLCIIHSSHAYTRIHTSILNFLNVTIYFKLWEIFFLFIYDILFHLFTFILVP